MRRLGRSWQFWRGYPSLRLMEVIALVGALAVVAGAVATATLLGHEAAVPSATTVPPPTTGSTVGSGSSTPPCPTPSSLANNQGLQALPRVVGNVARGRIAYNNLESMRLGGRDLTIEAVIAKGTADCLMRQIAGKVENKAIDVTARMTLGLVQPNDHPGAFDKPRLLSASSTQLILDNHPAHWAWGVTARRSGTYTLQLQPVLHLFIQGVGDGTIELDDIPVTIHVAPDVVYSGKKFLSDHQNILLGGITLSTVVTWVAWVVKWVRRRRKVQPESSPPPDREPAQLPDSVVVEAVLYCEPAAVPDHGVPEVTVQGWWQVWCPRCDELQVAQPDNQCVMCTTPLVTVSLERPDLPAPSLAKRLRATSAAPHR